MSFRPTIPFLGYATILCLFLLQACDKPTMKTTLDGYDKGKKTMQLDYQLTESTLPSGQPGYRLKSINHFSVGSKARRRLERTALLNEDLSLIETEQVFQSDDKTTRFSSRVAGDTITIKTLVAGEEDVVRTVQHKGPVFVELHSTRYFKDLKEPGTSKTYPVLLEDDGRIFPVKIIFVGPEEFYEDNRAISSLHFKIQVPSSPKEYDDYYLDPKTGNILKIQFGFIKFLPAQR